MFRECVFGMFFFDTPLKMNMEHKNHPIEQENHLPSLHVFGFKMFVFLR